MPKVSPPTAIDALWGTVHPANAMKATTT